jgi:glucoamylase
MPRSIVTGNGNLLIAMDAENMIRDLYYPHVGMEDHVAYQHFHRIGVWTDHEFSWLYDKEWQHSSQYLEDTVVTDSHAKNDRLKLAFDFNDFVYPTEDAFIRKITIRNDADHERHLKLFFAQDFHLYGDKQQDTAYFEPEHKALVHYRKRRYFWISGLTHTKEGVDSYTTGKSEYRGLEGTWKDAEDGTLAENPIEQGSVDSTVEFDLSIRPKSQATLYVWICAGHDLEEVVRLHKFILEEKPEKLLTNTVNYWHSWVSKEKQRVSSIPEYLQRAYKQSLLIMRTQIDNAGAVIAANDSDIMKFNKDTYTYMWPRDGAWVSIALDHAGYAEISKRFLSFCADVMPKEGYLMPKYNPDHSVGSNWHPWFKNHERQMPIQEDETASVTYALLHHFQQFHDIEFVQQMYDTLIAEAGNFMVKYVDSETDLPKASYDLWEYDRGIHTYTCSAVYAGLMAAGKLSEILGHFNHQRRYLKAAERLKEVILKYLYDKDLKRFLKKIVVDDDTGEIEKDPMIDASLHGIWMFGVLEPDDPRVASTCEAIYSALKNPTAVGGLARYQDDTYQRVHGDYTGIPGNPWIITTLWHAQWIMANAKTKEELKPVEEALQWTIGHMNKAGILPEQLSPFNGEHLSVAPLTWSHAAFVDTILKYNEKMKELF